MRTFLIPGFPGFPLFRTPKIMDCRLVRKLTLIDLLFMIRRIFTSLLIFGDVLFA